MNPRPKKSKLRPTLQTEIVQPHKVLMHKLDHLPSDIIPAARAVCILQEPIFQAFCMEHVEAQRQHAYVHPGDKVPIANITFTHPCFSLSSLKPTVQHQKFFDAVCSVRHSEDVFLSFNVVPVSSPDQETFTTVSYHVHCVFIFDIWVEIVFILTDCTIFSPAGLNGIIDMISDTRPVVVKETDQARVFGKSPIGG